MNSLSIGAPAPCARINVADAFFAAAIGGVQSQPFLLASSAHWSALLLLFDPMLMRALWFSDVSRASNGIMPVWTKYFLRNNQGNW
jgi:hypothetical protein